MYFIFEFLVQIIVNHDRSDSCDDFVDRLNRKYTVVLIIAFVTILTSKQYIGEPLACFCPAHFTGAHVEYTNNICWISTSFFVPIESFSDIKDKNGAEIAHNFNFKFNDGQTVPIHNTSHMKFVKIENIITYYPFLLLAQAILFYVPFFCWKNIIKKSVFEISTLISIAFDSQKSRNQAEREILLKYLVKHLDRTNEYYSKNNFKKDYNTNSRASKTYMEAPTSNRFRLQNSKNIFERIFDILTLRPMKKKLSFFRNYKNDFNNEKDSINSNRTTTNSYKINLFTIYLIIKILYILNCLGQFLILNIFISGENRTNVYYSENDENLRSDITFITSTNILKGFLFGYRTIVNLIENGKLFSERNRLLMFHTVVFCDFKIRMLGDRLHRHTVQCVVPINIFTEKVFTILWFWLFILNLINIFDFIKWTCYYFSKRIKLNFLTRHLMKSNMRHFSPISKHSSKAKSNEFKATLYSFLFNNNTSRNDFDMDIIEHMTRNFLLKDNIFILKLISENTSEIITRELVTMLLENFKSKCFLLYDENTV
ncbi:unnamed protein product [Brachionus calyciflorus]|uniref:Innexin n=1 Tax=Brachionus calyciflorus TaxID=104777 RepID=A0A813M066_9BILA|nr:unnamed protein product [Brachionus calyciflorus]